MYHISLSSSFPFVGGEVLPATSSPPHLIVFSTLLSLVFFQSSSSPAFLTSLLTQSSHLSIGLPRLLLPCSRNSAALFGSLSSAILSMCPAHCSLLLTSLSVNLLCTPVSSPFFSCLPSYIPFNDPHYDTLSFRVLKVNLNWRG